MVCSLIDAYPEYKSLFVSFKDIPRADLPGNKKFQAHGVNVAKAINTIIGNLTDADRLVSHLEGLGSRHAKRGVTKKTISVSWHSFLRPYIKGHFLFWSKIISSYLSDDLQR